MSKDLESENKKVINTFIEGLNIDEDFAQVLADSGFSTLEEIAYVPLEVFDNIEGMDQEIASQIQENAKKSLQDKASKERDSAVAELSSLEGIDKELAEKLYSKNVKSAEALAELATDDLDDIEGLDADKAGKIIMAARQKCWFSAE